MNQKQSAIDAGWIYSEEKHPSLKLNFAMRKTNKGIETMFSDRVLYNEREMFLMNSHNIKTNKKIHSVKKIFGGEIVKIGCD